MFSSFLLFLAVKALVLCSHQFSVKAAFGHQLSMASLLLHRPITEDNDMISLLHDAHIPRYQQDGAVDLLEQSLGHLWRTGLVLHIGNNNFRM